jgi:hypothetical protein
MMINNDKEPQEQSIEHEVTPPDEQPGIFVQSFLKIFDPESGEIIAQGRD